jgi:ribosomal protein S18 acetylase RimI-like enzyme
MSVDLRAASSLPPAELAALFTRAYEGYTVPVEIDEDALRFLVRTFDLDLDAGLVAFQDGAPAGLVNLGIRAERGWIGGLGVVAEARRQGIGRTLMEAVHDQARARGIREIALEVIEGNDAAFRLYEELGYETTRWLEIASLDQAGAGLANEHPPEEAHARIRELRSAPEPWQRDDGTLRHYDDLRGMDVDTGAAVFRSSGDGHVTVMQFAGDDAAAAAVLGSLRALGPVSLFNVPESDPLAGVAEDLGGHTVLRQREMTLSLQ